MQRVKTPFFQTLIRVEMSFCFAGVLGQVQTLSKGADRWVVGPEHPAGVGPAGVPKASVL